jgi:hypothetical protein
VSGSVNNKDISRGLTYSGSLYGYSPEEGSTSSLERDVPNRAESASSRTFRGQVDIQRGHVSPQDFLKVGAERDTRAKAFIAKVIPSMDPFSPEGRRVITKFIQSQYKGLEQQKFNDAVLEVLRHSDTN